MIEVLTDKKNVLLTTSRRPTRDMRTLCRDFSHSFPNVVRVNRGKLSLDGLAEKALEFKADRVMVIDRWKGGPGKIRFFNVGLEGLEMVPPLVYMKGVKLRRDFGESMPRGRRIKSLAVVTSAKRSLAVERLCRVLSSFFGIPVLSLKEAVNRGCDAVMSVSADSSGFLTLTFMLVPEFVEVGPRIRVSRLVWELS